MAASGEAAGPESIWQAIRELGAERIGHGVKAIEDRALMDFLAEQQIGIESLSDLQYSDQHRGGSGCTSAENVP